MEGDSNQILQILRAAMLRGDRLSASSSHTRILAGKLYVFCPSGGDFSGQNVATQDESIAQTLQWK
jgi:hypothetical protein